MSWFQFHDMHSGGGQKTRWARIYIEAATESDACAVFQSKTERDPHNVTCDCCGEDYSINESPSLAQASGYERGCRPLITPRVDGLYKPPADPYFQDHYWQEKGEVPKAPYVVEQTTWSGAKYETLDEYSKRDDVLIVPLSSESP